MIVDPFAGPGGWDEGLRELGLAALGIEVDAIVCATRYAAGHATWQADVAAIDPTPFAGMVGGCIFSPPCQDFSTNGKRAGLKGERGELVLEVPRWVQIIRPRWIACEQVPPVLDIWRQFAHWFEQWGYSTWTGILNAADYGVPQTRERAFLMASLDQAVSPPAATHAEHPQEALFGPALKPWITMADALGWGGVNTGCGWLKGGTREDAQTIEGWRPAPTVRTKSVGQWWPDRPGPKTLTVAEAAALQGFRADYPWRGSVAEQAEQVGNAIPPALAAAVLREVIA